MAGSYNPPPASTSVRLIPTGQNAIIRLKPVPAQMEQEKPRPVNSFHFARRERNCKQRPAYAASNQIRKIIMPECMLL